MFCGKGINYDLKYVLGVYFERGSINVNFILRM